MTHCGWREHGEEVNNLRNCQEKNEILPHQVACSIFEARDGAGPAPVRNCRQRLHLCFHHASVTQ